jgi:hypothetical protein
MPGNLELISDQPKRSAGLVVRRSEISKIRRILGEAALDTRALTDCVSFITDTRSVIQWLMRPLPPFIEEMRVTIVSRFARR